MIENYTNWKLLFEDDNQCFSKALDKDTDNPVLIITVFDPQSIQKSVKLLIADTLQQYYDAFEDENGYHIVLKAIEGTSLIKWLQEQKLPYAERVQLTYEWVKNIQKYDVLPDAIKIQLIDFEQIVVKDNQLFAREWVNYIPDEELDWISVFKQVGETLEILLPDAPEKQSQFIDLLKVGKHEFFSIALFRKAFKDVFLYEKSEAIDNINFEFDIVLNDRLAGPPITLKKPTPKVAEISEAITSQSLKVNDEPINDIDFQEKFETETELEMTFEPEAEIDTQSAFEVALEADVQIQAKTENEPEPEIVPDFKHSDDMPEFLPKSQIKRAWDDDDDLDFLPEIEGLFDDAIETKPKWRIKWKESLVIGLMSALIIALLALGAYWLLKDKSPVTAAFEIEATKIDKRVPFMNKSTGGKKIEAYQWDLYYDDKWIQSFEDKDLFILFETEGSYTVTLKVKDKNGTWSEPYEATYHHQP